MTNELISALLEISSLPNFYSFCITFYLYFLLHIAELYVYVISEIYLVILSIYVYGTGLSTIKRGCVKMYTSSFLCTKPRLSQAKALLFPKVFVPLGIKKISL
ncbi:hypothetical protein BC673_1485 [Prevotella pallens]|uniref:Uncharacterized protein n=1 Tax=Prevotella pallens TaxID=60133 RepID=A0ABX9DN05_9BACT|nr:hypothetical protein BC673_1485 [Prevotella pallens]